MSEETGLFVGAAGGVIAGYLVIQYVDGWENASEAEKIGAAIAGLFVFNTLARGVA